jgi:competence protein ComEC
MFSYQAQLSQNNGARLRSLTRSFDSVKLNYCLTSQPALAKSRSFGKPTYTAKVAASRPFSSTGLLMGSLSTESQGDCFTGLVRLSPGFESSRIFFVAKLSGKPRIVHRASESGSAQLKSRFLSSVRGVTPDSGGLVAGLSIGDTSKLSADLLADFKVLSLTHLTAVSGTNCAIVLSLVWLLASRIKFGRHALTRWPRLALAFFALAGYTALVGNQPSVLRASVMVFFVLLAKTLGRPTSAINALVLACGVLLVLDPWLVFEYGFLLSVLACIGILTVAPVIARLLERRFGKTPEWLRVAVAVSFSAQILCFPVLLLLQNGFSTYSVLANLIAEPMVLPITVIGLLAVLASTISLPIATFLTFNASFFAAPVIWVAHSMSRWPSATGFWPKGTTGVFLAIVVAVGFVSLAAIKMVRARLIAFAMIMAVALVVAPMATISSVRVVAWAKPGWFMVSCNVGQGDATVIRSKNQVALIDVGRDPAMIDTCLKQLHINHIDLLELTHFDLDHVAGLSGALAGRKIDLALLTPFVDTRPGANDARASLENQGVPVQVVETGLHGVIGDFTWQVLSPHRGGFEATDSNDGSITMLWRSEGVDIITLADLGQKGQLRLAEEADSWVDSQLSSVPLVMKVSHHGSADQDPNLMKLLHPTLALISVGKRNSYGHPTSKTLNLLSLIGSTIERTDQRASISVALQEGGFALGFQGEQG